VRAVLPDAHFYSQFPCTLSACSLCFDVTYYELCQTATHAMQVPIAAAALFDLHRGSKSIIFSNENAAAAAQLQNAANLYSKSAFI
jgi:hypothetical protein